MGGEADSLAVSHAAALLNQGKLQRECRHLHPLESHLDENQDPALNGRVCLGGHPGMGTGTHRWHPDAPTARLGHCSAIGVVPGCF